MAIDIFNNTPTAPTGEALLTDPQLAAECEVIAAEAIGWEQLAAGVYWHRGQDDQVVEIVGQASASMANSNVVWVWA